jgi:hypothetical protein
LELRNPWVTGAGARSTFSALRGSAAAAIWTLDAASKAEPRIIRIVFRILNLLVVQAPDCEAKDMSLSGSPIQIAMGHADYYASAHHETASQFVGQTNSRLNIQHPYRRDDSVLESDNFGGLLLADPVQWRPNRACLARQTDEEACISHSLDGVACVGANEIVTEGRDRSCRQLRSDRPDRRRQAGVFDEVREFAGAAATAAAG